MKIVRYIASLFVPTLMGLRRNINVIISVVILFLASSLIAIPYMEKFEGLAYETYCEYESYNFRVMDPEKSKEIDFTEEEIARFEKDYVLTNINGLKNIDFAVQGGEIVVPSDAKTYDEIEYNGKEYLLKREVYNYDSDGTKLDEVDVYYIHIVFDIFKDLKDQKYSYKEQFDKKLNLTEENHFLIVFYIDGFSYRNEFMVDNNRVSYGFEYGEVEMAFNEIEQDHYITAKISEMLIPNTKSQYTYNSFIYAVIAPAIIALAFFALIRRKTVLVKYKHYFNIVALCSIPISLIFFGLEWNDMMIRFGIIDLYWPVLAIYYFICIRIINKRESLIGK